MKSSIKKFTAYITALVLVASAVFLCCGFAVKLPRGVFVNGYDVGGMTVGAAKNALRREVENNLKEKRLRICVGERVCVYAYPEIDYRDGFGELLSKVVKAGDYFASVHYFLNGADEIAQSICADYSRAPTEPYAVFNTLGEPFTYCSGEDGIVCDKQKLLDDISASLNGNFERVSICTSVVKRRETVEDIKAKTQKLCAFTTYFDGENKDRCDNIRLAAQKINGTVIGAGEEFSFNGTVGARTADNGFKPAKIIENGKFVQGYGGGVCQVSTTLYNAAVLSGLEVTEYHPHSLQVSYVSPSRDAMVSGSYFDLKFKNNRLTPIYVRVNCTLNSIKCTVYGESDGFEYSIVSKVTGTIPRPPAEIEDGAEEGGENTVVSYGRDGTVSEGYLVKRRGGEETSELLRKDKYSAVADVIRRVGKTTETAEN